MCNDCRDISDRVNKTQNVSAGGTIWQLPSGVNLTSPTDGVVMRTGSTSSSLMGDDTIYYDNAFPSKTDILTFKGEMDVVAFECSLYPCVHTYNSTVRDTRTTEQLLSAFAMKPAIGLGPFAGSSNDPYFYSALPMPCLINGSYYDASSFTRPNLTNSIAVPGLLPHNKTGYVPPDCYFTFESPGLMQNLPGYLNGYVMEAPEVDDAEPGWLRQLFSVDNVTVVSVNQSWTNIANSMTVRVRQSPDGMNLSSTSGDAWHMETCISIRWPWLAYSAALLALAMVFLLATIAQSMHHSRKHLWKSSILAALFHGLDTDLREKFRHVDKSEEMERTAKRLVVRLGREEEESRLIEVPLSEQDQAKMTLKDLPRSEKHLAKLVSQGPRPLRPDSKLRLLGLAMELFICLLPISFIVLAITAKYLEGHEVSNYGERIKDWSMLAPSIFPLVFAAVIGQSLRSIARYKVEKGWKLKYVEQFIGSQSLFGTIANQARLRFIDLVGLALILLWLLSPLSGQASLRLLSTRGATTVSTGQIGYANLSGTNSIYYWTDGPETFQTTVNGLYTMNLLSPLSIKESPQDIWGNVKIPTYESLRTEAESGFKPVPSGNGTDWISLIGLPLTGLDRRARVNSTISTWYYYVNCSHMEGVHNTTNWTAKFGLPKDATNKNAWNTSQWKIFFSGKYDSTGYPESPPVTMLFASWSGEINGHNGVYYPANVTIGNCSIEPSYVDVKVVCKDLSCHAEGARRSSINRPPVNSSSGTAQAWWGELLEGPGENVIRNPSDSFLSPWTTSDNASIAGQISPTLNYIAGTEAFPFAAPVDDHFLGYQAITTAPELHKLDVDAVARRLRRLLNTYWQASTGPQSHNAAVPKDSPAMKSAANTYLDSTLSMALSDATFEHDARVYHCDTSWLAITLIVSGIVLVVGFVGLVASCACVGPDLLNSFTTALRSNPNTAKSLNGDNSTLDSSEVAKANRNIVVALQDVRPDEDVGLLAIGTGNDRSGSRKNVSDARRRNEGRFYD